MSGPRPPLVPNKTIYTSGVAASQVSQQYTEYAVPDSTHQAYLDRKRQMFRPTRRKESDRYLKPISSNLSGGQKSKNSSSFQLSQHEDNDTNFSPKPNLSRLIEIGGHHQLAELPIEKFNIHQKSADTSWLSSASRKPQDTLQRITVGVASRIIKPIKQTRHESTDLGETKPNASKNFMIPQIELADNEFDLCLSSPRAAAGIMINSAARYSCSPNSGDFKMSQKSLLPDEDLITGYSGRASPDYGSHLHDFTDRCFEQIRLAKQLQKEGQKFRELIKLRGSDLVSSIFSKKGSLTTVQDTPNRPKQQQQPKIHFNLEEKSKDKQLDNDIFSAKSYQFSQALSRKDEFMSKSYDDRSDRNILDGKKNSDLRADPRKQRLNSINIPSKTSEELGSNEATKLDLRYHRKSYMPAASSRAPVQVQGRQSERPDSARLRRIVGNEKTLPESVSKEKLVPKPNQTRMRLAASNYLVLPRVSKQMHPENISNNRGFQIASTVEDMMMGGIPMQPTHTSAAKAHELAEIRAKYRFLE
jgi:hypothetical protein